jgi:multidrug resistance efflux pump
MPPAADRVRAITAEEVLRRIDDTTAANLLRLARAAPEAARARLDELDREWDTDRVLEVEAATMGLLGLAAAVLWRPQFLVLPAVVAASVLLQARTGRYPLMPLFRRLGIRTAREIERERYAVKALRGDFSRVREQAGSDGDAPAPGRGPRDSHQTQSVH